MSSALLRGVAGRASTAAACSSRPSEQPRVAPEAHASRRSVLLGMGAGLAGLMSNATGARAAGPMLSDLTRPYARALDFNGDGLLDVDEIRGAMQRGSGISVSRETVVREVMSPVDFDDDGNLTVDEFARGMALEVAPDERWMAHLEVDGAAGISAEELEAGLGYLGPQGQGVVRAAFKMADTNRDGRLDTAEATHAMRLVAYGILGDAGDE